MDFMRSFLKILVLCLLLLTSTSCHLFSRWRGPCSIWPIPEPEFTGGTPVTQTFSSAQGRFRFGMPASEKDGSEDKKDFNWFVLNVGKFHITYHDYAQVVDTPEVSESIFNNIRDQVMSKWPSGQLEVDSPITLSGHPGRELRFKDETGAQIDRMYLAGNRLYIVSAFVPKSLHCKLGSAVKVLDTFAITE